MKDTCTIPYLTNEAKIDANVALKIYIPKRGQSAAASSNESADAKKSRIDNFFQPQPEKTEKAKI